MGAEQCMEDEAGTEEGRVDAAEPCPHEAPRVPNFQRAVMLARRVSLGSLSSAKSRGSGTCKGGLPDVDLGHEMMHTTTIVSRRPSGSKQESSYRTNSWRSHLSSIALPEEVLRGVRLSQLLGHGTLPWRTGPGGLSEHSQGLLWGLSSPVKEIDCFLSHSWSAPGWMKYVQLVLMHGTLHGLAGAFMVLLALVLLLAQRVLPPMASHASHINISGSACHIYLSMWCLLIVPPIGLAVLFSSRSLPRQCGADPVVFLDVACISQTDELLKIAGIKALSSILHHSKELHVMWSPDYFSRLWCVYELAAFMCINTGCIHFRPLFMEPAILVFVIFNWLTATFIMLVLVVGYPKLLQALIIVYCGLLAFCMHLLRCCMRDKRALTSQLEVFDLRNAMCREESDRAHILQSIQHWYGSEEAFNEHVREEVLQAFTEDTRATDVPYCLALVSGSGVPFCIALELLLGMVNTGVRAMDLLHMLVCIINQLCFVYPILARVFFMLAERSATDRHLHWIHDWAISLAAVIPCAVLATLTLGLDLLLARRATMFGSLGFSAALAILTWVIFTSHRLCRGRL